MPFGHVDLLNKKIPTFMKFIVPGREVVLHGKLLRRYGKLWFCKNCTSNLLLWISKSIVFSFIMQYLMPFVEKEKYQISPQCRLHPSNDLFRDQEEHKIHVDVNEWRCGYCKKIFRAEKYLDQHFDNRHYNLLNAVGQLVLLFIWYNNAYSSLICIILSLWVTRSIELRLNRIYCCKLVNAVGFTVGAWFAAVSCTIECVSRLSTLI